MSNLSTTIKRQIMDTPVRIMVPCFGVTPQTTDLIKTDQAKLQRVRTHLMEISPWIISMKAPPADPMPVYAPRR